MVAQKKISGLLIGLSLMLTLFPLVTGNERFDVVWPGYTNKQNSDTAVSIHDPLEVIDQKQEEMSGICYGVYPPWEFAQSFTPTLTKLTRVSLYLGQEEGTPDDFEITVSIKKNLIEDDLISISKLSGIFRDTEPCWVDFDFPDINITPENRYYILVKASAGTDRFTVCWHYHYGDPYPRGSGWGSHDNGFEWFILEKYFWDFVDFTFQAYGYNYPSSVPVIKGTIEGKLRTAYPYTFTATDPEGYNVSYFIDWGDGTQSEWLGPYPSSKEITVNHTWNKKETYTVMAKARDMHGDESGWATLEVSMPKNKDICFHILFLRFIEIMQSRISRFIFV